MTIKECILSLRELGKKHPDKREAINYACDFIKKHNKENVIKYKDYVVPVFFSEKDGMLYGKAINPTNPKYIVLVNGNSVASFIEDLRFSIDTLETIEQNNYSFGIDVVEMPLVDEEESEEQNTKEEAENNDNDTATSADNESDQGNSENNGQDNDSEE